MKKLIRWHYKEYLFFLVITVVAVIAIFEQEFNMYYYSDLTDFYQGMQKETLNFYLGFYLDMMFYYVIKDTFLGKVLWIVSGSILLQRAFFNWNLKDSSGRCYFAFLPFRKADYNKLFILRDVITIVVTLFAIVLYAQYRIHDYLNLNEIQIPWLGNAIAGVAVLADAYFLFLLGIYILLESLFVNGILKMVSSLGIMGILSFVLGRIYEVFGGYPLIYKMFVYKPIEVPIFYQGTQVFLSWDYEVDEKIYFGGTLGNLYDFADTQTYLTHSLLYLVIAILCAIVSIWLVKRHEESKDGFYHVGTPYALMCLAAVTLFVMYYEKNMTILQVITGCIFSILLFVLLCGLYAFRGKRLGGNTQRLPD